MFLGIAGMAAFMVYSGYRAYQLTDWPIEHLLPRKISKVRTAVERCCAAKRVWGGPRRTAEVS